MYCSQYGYYAYYGYARILVYYDSYTTILRGTSSYYTTMDTSYDS